MSAVSHWTVDPNAAMPEPGTFLLRATARIERPLPEVFDFFAAAENLERITPPSLRFRIVTPTPIEMRPGALIDYRLRLNGIPFGWRTEITEWHPPGDGGVSERRGLRAPADAPHQIDSPDASFTDTQLRGPYHTWVHRHLFRAAPGRDGGATATDMIDEVRYRLPLWPLGGVALPIVRRQLRWIFTYRAEVLSELFE